MGKSPQDKKPLIPRKVVEVKGKVHYSESNQAWNIIKLKQEFLREFNQLKEKRSKFSYEFLFSRDDAELIKSIKEKNKEALPILMFLYKEE